MKRVEFRPNANGYRDNLIEIFTVIDAGDFDQAASFVKQYKSLSLEAISKAGIPGDGIDFGLLDRAIQNLYQQQASLARDALAQFDTAICHALDNQSFLSKVMNRRNRR